MITFFGHFCVQLWIRDCSLEYCSGVGVQEGCYQGLICVNIGVVGKDICGLEILFEKSDITEKLLQLTTWNTYKRSYSPIRVTDVFLIMCLHLRHIL